MPLWIKIMGIVVVPLLLVSSSMVVLIRLKVMAALQQLGRQDVLDQLYPVMTQDAILWVVLAVSTGALLAYIISRVLTHPLHELLQVIRKLETGDLHARTQVWANDEIGQVQAAFNQMADRLEQTQIELLDRNRQLVFVNQVTQSISLNQNPDEILKNALQQIRSLLRADLATLYLLDESGESLILKTHHGDLPSSLIGKLSRVAVAHSPMQSVIQNSSPVVIADLRQAPNLPSELVRELTQAGIGPWASSPILLKGRLIGLLNLSRTSSIPFDREDLTILAAVGSVVGVVLSNTQLVEDLQRKETELRRALQRAVELQEEERKRLARELHDEAGQALTSILIRLRTLQDERDLETISDRLDGLRYLTSQTIEELRRMAMNLRPSALDNLGVIPALRWYIQQMSTETGCAIQFQAPDKLERLAPEIELILYRVAQEGVTNAIRHSRAQAVEVHLSRRPHTIWLSINDDGQGFDPALIDQGLGLIGIRERVELVKGKFGIETAPGAGTRLWIELAV